MECSKHTTCRGWSLHRIIWTILTYSPCIIIFLAYSTNTIHKNKTYGTSFKEDASRKISPYLVTSCFSSRLQLCETRMHSSRMRTVRCSGHRGWGGLPMGGVCLGGSAWGCLPGAGCLPRGSCLGGVYPSMQWGRHPPLWIEFLTHACENITFPQLQLWKVIISSSCD